MGLVEVLAVGSGDPGWGVGKVMSGSHGFLTVDAQLPSLGLVIKMLRFGQVSQYPPPPACALLLS